MVTRVTQIDTITPLTVLQQGATTVNVTPPSVSGANSAQTITINGVAGQRISVRTIAIKATGAAVTSTVTVQDGANTILDLGTLSIPLGGPSTIFTGDPLFTASPGNNVVINVSAGGVLAVTTVSVIADRQ